MEIILEINGNYLGGGLYSLLHRCIFETLLCASIVINVNTCMP